MSLGGESTEVKSVVGGELFPLSMTGHDAVQVGVAEGTARTKERAWRVRSTIASNEETLRSRLTGYKHVSVMSSSISLVVEDCESP